MLAFTAGTAAAEPSKADKAEAQKECRAEQGTTDATHEAFKAKHGNFGKCVSEKAREAKAERNQARRNAARECREERGDTEASREAFRNKYGTNANKKNAFGKCVSQKAKAKRAEQEGRRARRTSARPSRSAAPSAGRPTPRVRRSVRSTARTPTRRTRSASASLRRRRKAKAKDDS